MLDFQHILDYTTRSGLYTFRFGFLYTGARWRAYQLTPIEYGSLASDGPVTHRYHDAQNNLFFLCWDPEPNTLEEMQAVVAMWCELMQTYLCTGETMDAQYARLYGRGN